MFDYLCDYIHHELEELDHRVKSGGGLDAHDVQCGDMLAHFAKNLATYIAMEESGQDAEEIRRHAYDDGMSYGYDTRTRRSMADRDMDGGRSYRRGSSRRGMSRADGMDGMLQMLDGEMDNMPEELRREAQRFRDMARQYA